MIQFIKEHWVQYLIGATVAVPVSYTHLGIRDAIEAVAALGVLLNVPSHEIRGVTGNLDEFGVDQALSLIHIYMDLAKEVIRRA